MVTKREIQAELNAGETEKAVARVREVIAEHEEFERWLTKAEDAVGRQPHWSANDPIVERLRRVGVSPSECRKRGKYLEAMSAITLGREVDPEVQRELDEQSQAEDSALAQLANIVSARR